MGAECRVVADPRWHHETAAAGPLHAVIRLEDLTPNAAV